MNKLTRHIATQNTSSLDYIINYISVPRKAIGLQHSEAPSEVISCFMSDAHRSSQHFFLAAVTPKIIYAQEMDGQSK